jgi:oxalate decarboxylase/phosphoglucose isomerase-like protein (cupin superfamily)
MAPDQRRACRSGAQSPVIAEPETPFSRCNVFALPLEQVTAHGGLGRVDAVRIGAAGQLAGCCEFIDYAEVRPGGSIGSHRHASHEEEYYLVLGGSGQMQLEDEVFAVTAGDLVRNPAGGLHGLTNTGAGDLRLFIFALTISLE